VHLVGFYYKNGMGIFKNTSAGVNLEEEVKQQPQATIDSTWLGFKPQPQARIGSNLLGFKPITLLNVTQIMNSTCHTTKLSANCHTQMFVPKRFL